MNIVLGTAKELTHEGLEPKDDSQRGTFQPLLLPNQPLRPHQHEGQPQLVSCFFS